MRLLSPWGLLGLVAIAGPIAAHLLARRPPKTLRFPNLRFLPPTTPTPVKGHRVADHALLVLRIGIVALAALALAGPTKSGTADSQVLGYSGASGTQVPGFSGSSGSPGSSGSVSRDLAMLTAPADRAGADAAVAAAIQQGAPGQVAGDRDVALVFPGFETRESWLKDAAPLSEPWMSDLYTTVATDALVKAAAARLNLTPLELLKAAGDRAQPERLLLFIDAPPDSLFATATTSAILRSVPSSLSSGSSVQPVPSAPVEQEPPPAFARWLWLAAGFLLLAETFIRRRRPASVQQEEHARVA